MKPARKKYPLLKVTASSIGRGFWAKVGKERVTAERLDDLRSLAAAAGYAGIRVLYK